PTAPTEFYTLSLHDALPISEECRAPPRPRCYRPTIPFTSMSRMPGTCAIPATKARQPRLFSKPDGEWAPMGIWSTELASSYTQRSEEHTSELQSRSDLVCRL